MSPNYRSLVPGGFYSSDPFDKTVRVSIRCNNAGAINGAKWEKDYPGYVDTVETTPGNKTTIFEAPEFGVAVWWELLRRYRKAGAKTVGAIVEKYGGGQDYSDYVDKVVKWSGLAASTEIALDDDTTLLAFARAMFRYEAGQKSPLSDKQILFGLALGRVGGDVTKLPQPVAEPVRPTEVDAPRMAFAAIPGDGEPIDTQTIEGISNLQAILIACGYLDPPVDASFGPVSTWALKAYAAKAGIALPDVTALPPALIAALRSRIELPLQPGDDFIGRVVKAMQRNGYWIARHPDCRNIVYVEGCNPDGKKNDNRVNAFNDLRIVFHIDESGRPVIDGKWEATTEPGKKFTLEPMNPDGAFHIKLGQYKAWIVGWYHTHEALRQAGEIEGHRDPDRTFGRDPRHPVKGADFGVHQHWGYDLPVNDLGKSSAGCLVGRSTAGHREFMGIVKSDARYAALPTYRFVTAVMAYGDL